MSEEYVDALAETEAEAAIEASKGFDDLEMPQAPEEAEDANGDSSPKKRVVVLEEPDESLVGVKVAKDFDGVPYIGEIKGARKTKGGPLYKVLYRDGDEEEFSTAEANEAKEKYNVLQSDMWECMINLVEDLDVSALTDAGITTIADLELFGGGAAKASNSGTPFDSLDIPLKTKQQLYITATYLLNDQILTKDSKLEEMARYNLAKTTGTQHKPRADKGVKRTVVKRQRVVRKAVKAVSTVKKARGRPKKAVAEKAAPKPAKPSARATKVAKKAVAKPRAPPAAGKSSTTAKTSSTPKTGYSGPPTEPLEGVSDWPGSASKDWTYTIKPRGSDSRLVDRYWTSPSGVVLRSKIEVRKFLIALEQNDGDEAEAKNCYKKIEL
jgi:hypothetical protein